MAKIKRILAPTDFSELSKVGIRYALEMARDVSAQVVVYHAIDVGGEWKDRPPEVAAYHDMLEDGRRLLDKFLGDNFADCIDLVEVRCAVEFGTPHKNIVEKAAEEGVDMIVMSTHGRTGLNHIIMGSVAEKVVARATCPVLVVPHDGRRPGLIISKFSIASVMAIDEVVDCRHHHAAPAIFSVVTGIKLDSRPGLKDRAIFLELVKLTVNRHPKHLMLNVRGFID
jgi:nucleotide-binding universal stress UspA family protein